MTIKRGIALDGVPEPEPKPTKPPQNRRVVVERQPANQHIRQPVNPYAPWTLQWAAAEPPVAYSSAQVVANASYRSPDGSDLPARVKAAVDWFKQAQPDVAVKGVLLGQKELAELVDILYGEAGFPRYNAERYVETSNNLTVAGVKVVRSPAETCLQVLF